MKKKKTQEAKVIEYLKTHGRITIRQLAADLNINSVYTVMKKVKDKLDIIEQRVYDKKRKIHYKIFIWSKHPLEKPYKANNGPRKGV